MLNMLPPPAALGCAGAPKLFPAEPNPALGAPKAGGWLAGAPNGLFAGAGLGAAAPKLKTPAAV